MDMRALYYIALPVPLGAGEDAGHHEEDIKANENCLNQNFTLLAGKIYEYEERIAELEAQLRAVLGQ